MRCLEVLKSGLEVLMGCSEVLMGCLYVLNRMFRGANRMFTCERCRSPPKGRPGETLPYNGVLGGNRVCLEGV